MWTWAKVPQVASDKPPKVPRWAADAFEIGRAQPARNEQRDPLDLVKPRSLPRSDARAGGAYMAEYVELIAEAYPQPNSPAALHRMESMALAMDLDRDTLLQKVVAHQTSNPNLATAPDHVRERALQLLEAFDPSDSSDDVPDAVVPAAVASDPQPRDTMDSPMPPNDDVSGKPVHTGQVLSLGHFLAAAGVVLALAVALFGFAWIRIDKVEEKFTGQVKELRAELGEARKEISGMRTEVSNMRVEVARVAAKLESVETLLAEVRDELKARPPR